MIIAQALINLQDKFGTTIEGAIDLTLSRQDLAAYVGTTYETLFRMMNELVQEGIIRLQDKNIVIANHDALQLLTVGH